MKKILALIMVALLIFCIASCGKKDEDTDSKETNNLSQKPSMEVETGTFVFDANEDGEYEIIDYTPKTIDLVDLTLPKSTADGHDIVGIGEGAFKADNTIKSVTIPETYKYIGKQAFYDCGTLVTVTTTDSIVRIDEGAFTKCTNLANMTWSKSLDTVSAFAFSECKSLTSANLSNATTVIGEGAFFECKNLTDVTISDKLVSVENNAFLNCDQLKFGTFDNGLYLGNESNPYIAFIGVNNLNVKECTVNDSTKIIATDAFANCDDLKDVTLGKSVTHVNGDCFTNSDNIEYFEYENAFYLKLGTAEDAGLVMIAVDNSSVEKFTVHERTAIIADSALAECENIRNISYAKTAEDWNKILKSDTWNHDMIIVIYCKDAEINS